MAIHRRDLLNGAFLGAIAAAVPGSGSVQRSDAPGPGRPWKIIDTNIDLFQWPFRRLPYDSVNELAEKLRSLQIEEGWAGSYEGVLQRDIGGVNTRLVESCRKQGRGLLIPFGSVNLALPDWEEDLRRCHENFGMPGIRLHPNYHGYSLDDPKFERLLAMSAERGLLVQLAVSMEDGRTQHPKLQVPDVDLAPLPDVIRKIPTSKVLILNYKPRGDMFNLLLKTPRIYLETGRVESTNGVARLLRSLPERVMFGTHAPFFIYESALIRVYESELSDAENRAILERNARRLGVRFVGV